MKVHRVTMSSTVLPENLKPQLFTQAKLNDLVGHLDKKRIYLVLGYEKKTISCNLKQRVTIAEQ